MPDSGVNLISQGQLQEEGYTLKIVLAEIEIGPDHLLAKLIENNLYILDTISFQHFFFLPCCYQPRNA